MQNEIDLWFVEPGTINSATLLGTYRTLLSEQERARGARFYFEKHRRDYLITRALVRTVLSERVGLPAHLLRFDVNAYGRPYLRQCPDLSFNLSHTEGMIALAVTGNGQISYFLNEAILLY